MMHLTITRSDLLDLLHQVIHVVSTRATLPILNNVLIEATADTLTLVGTDLDTYATVHVEQSSELEIHTPGSITVPARRLAGIIKEMPDSGPLTLTVETATQSLRIESGNGSSQFRILGIAVDEFPPIPVIESPTELAIPPEILINGIRKTLFAASRDETRYILNGILIHIVNNSGEMEIRFVCTDGRRLAMVTNSLPKDLPIPSGATGATGHSLIIPTKTAGEIQRLLSHGSTQAVATFLLPGEADTATASDKFSIRVGDAQIHSKTIAGKFPNYQQVIPAQPAITVTVPREAFLSGVQRVALMSPKGSGSIKLAFNEENITLSANAPDVGESSEVIQILHVDRLSDSGGAKFPLVVAYNPEFLMGALHQLQEDVIAFELVDNHSPATLKTPANPDFLYVLMPMRVS